MPPTVISTSEYHPGTHVHSLTNTDPTSLVLLPNGQSKQDELSAAVLYIPYAQASHRPVALLDSAPAPQDDDWVVGSGVFVEDDVVGD